MPHSLKNKIKSLCYKGELSEKERDRIIQALEQEQRDCKTCKYYTGKTGGRISKTKRYCNRTATINMHPDDFCSRWDKREEMQNDKGRSNK